MFGYVLVDLLIGQVVWIFEKFWFWMDCDGYFENVLNCIEFLDNVFWYWFIVLGVLFVCFYWESFVKGGNDFVEVLVGCSFFLKEIFRVLCCWVEVCYCKFVYWNCFEKGGYFVVFEWFIDFV